MTTHELAALLLKQPNIPVGVRSEPDSQQPAWKEIPEQDRGHVRYRLQFHETRDIEAVSELELLEKDASEDDEFNRAPFCLLSPGGETLLGWEWGTRAVNATPPHTSSNLTQIYPERFMAIWQACKRNITGEISIAAAYYIYSQACGMPELPSPKNFPPHKCGLTLRHNEHLNTYQTANCWIRERESQGNPPNIVSGLSTPMKSGFFTGIRTRRMDSLRSRLQHWKNCSNLPILHELPILHPSS